MTRIVPDFSFFSKSIVACLTLLVGGLTTPIGSYKRDTAFSWAQVKEQDL